MDNNKRMGIFIVVIAGVLLIAMGIYTYIFNENQKKANQAVNTNPAANPNALIEQAKQNQPKPVLTFNSSTEASRVWNSEDIKKVALSFAAFFGSYSNQASYANFTDLEPQMTDSLAKWVNDTYIPQLRQADKDAKIYSGITTVAVAGTVKKFDDAAGQAEVLVSTKRQQTQGTKATSFNQDLLLDLLKVGGEWKFDSAHWQK